MFFSGLESNILNATENELIASVPYGAYYTPISLNINGLYATSSQRFNVIFNAAEELTVEHLANQLDNPYLGAKYKDIKIADLNEDGIPEIVTSEAGSGSEVGSDTSADGGWLGSGFAVPQLIQNFSSAEIAEPQFSQKLLGSSEVDTIFA